MTHLQKRQIEQSEIREQIAEILNAEGEPDRAALASLTKRSADLELELRAATIADGGMKEIETRSDPESRELEGLIIRSNVGEIFGRGD